MWEAVTGRGPIVDVHAHVTPQVFQRAVFFVILSMDGIFNT
jgi:hypothetical protein